jgi:transcriptional regulator CtsR
MILSQEIAKLIEQMLRDADGELSIGRNELAERFGCVPSQINYVITSRFTPERGYLVESRRGGGGYIRIRKVAFDRHEYLMHFYQAIGESIDPETSRAFLVRLVQEGIVTEREAELTFTLLSDQALARIPKEERNEMRADLFRSAVLKLAAMKA